MLRTLEHQDLSAATRRQARAILRRALGHAERWGLVTRNAAALVEAPKSQGSRLDDVLTRDEGRALIATARCTRLEALVTVVLAMGLRKGEALALRWDDLDQEAGWLTVRATLKRRPGNGLVLDTRRPTAGAARFLCHRCRSLLFANIGADNSRSACLPGAMERGRLRIHYPRRYPVGSGHSDQAIPRTV